MSSRERVEIITDLRPPVVVYGGRSPLRSSACGSPGRNNSKPRSPVAANKLNEDGKPVCEMNWDQRHHIVPSMYNDVNHTYYKVVLFCIQLSQQYFDKSQRMKEIIAMRPQKMPDPYELNQIKGTRMPDYSRVIKERDIYGELGWVPNFQVKLSKNNGRMHRAYKEFFDQPQNYQPEVYCSTVTSSQFIRKNAPPTSVAKQRNSMTNMYVKSFQNSTMGSTNGFTQTVTSASPFSTPFYMVEDHTNKYKIDGRLKQTQDQKNMIPFLRTNDEEYIKVIKTNRTFRSRSVNQSACKGYINYHNENPTSLERRQDQAQENQKKKSSTSVMRGRVVSFLKRREHAWNQYQQQQQQPQLSQLGMQYQKSPVYQNQVKAPKDRFSDYSPLQNVNLSKYNFDYAQSVNATQIISSDSTPKDLLIQSQPYSKFNPMNQRLNDPSLQQVSQRARDNSANEALRVQRDLGYGASTPELVRMQQQQFQQQQPQQQMPPVQNSNSFLQNSQLLQMLQQQQQPQQMLDPMQNNPQYMQLVFQQQQQQQQLQLIQQLINQSSQISQQNPMQPQPTQFRTQPQTMQNAQSLDLSKLLKQQPPQMQQPPTMQQQLGQGVTSSQQQMLYQQLLQLQQQQQQLSSVNPQVYNSQQFKNSPLLSEVQSQVPTPLETTRLISQSQTTLPSQVPQQHQFFVQNYQQLQDNLSQYRKLVSYLEQIENKKQGTPLSMAQQQMVSGSGVEPQKLIEKYESIRVQNDFTESGFQQDMYTQPITQGEPKQIITKEMGSSITWPSKLPSDNGGGQEKSFTSPSSRDPAQSLKSAKEEQQYLLDAYHEHTPKTMFGGVYQNPNSQLLTLNSNKSLQDLNNKSLENQLLGESKFIDGDFDNENVEDSKSSEAEVTKESLTDQLNSNLLNSNNPNILPLSQQSDTNKSHRTLLVEDADESSVHHKSHQSIDQNNRSTLSERKLGSGARSSQDQSSSMTHEENPSSSQNVDEKPVANVQMTFEELLESKLQQQQEQKSNNSNSQTKPKKEFLRRQSNGRMQTTSIERNKSQSKQYRYYADNFANQQQLQVQQLPQQQQVTISPKSVGNNSQFAKRQTNAQGETSTPSKKQQFLQKSNQKQPKQQKTVPNRPHSQQQQSSSQQKNQINRSRQANIIQNNSSVNTSKVPQTLEIVNMAAHLHEEENLMSDRNSVAEFEMLEKECNAKCQHQQMHHQLASDQSIISDPQSKPSTTPSSSQQQAKHQPKLTKAPLDYQQKQQDQKVKELELEIQKLKKENNKVQQLQRECVQQLQRVTKDMEDFALKKEQDLQEMQDWKLTQLAEIDKERKALEQERQELRKMKDSVQTNTNNDNDILTQRIKILEAEKLELNKRLDEQTDKELTNKAVQTNISTAATKDIECNTVISGCVIQEPERLSQANSPIKFASPEKYGGLSQQKYEEKEPIKEEDKEDSDTSVKNEVQAKSPVKSPRVEKIKDEQQSEHEPDSLDNGEEEDEEEDEFDLKFPAEYHGKNLEAPKIVEEVTGHDGKIQRFYDNGKKEVVFTNGVKREIWPDGYSVVYFNNNDIKQTFPDQKIVYYFCEAQTTQTTFPNGLQVFKFSNNQIEKHFADGTKEISFPDGTIKCIFPDGEEESIFPDGTIQKIEKTGVRIIEFPSGQRDILYPDGTKVREFEDGSIKKIYPDGRVEMMQPKTQQQIQQNKKEFNVTLSKHQSSTTSSHGAKRGK